MFVTPLVLEVSPEPGIWTVWQDCQWKDPIFGLVVLPQGFRTDLASTPQFLRACSEFDPSGLSRRPAAFHDGAYARLFGWDKDKADQFLRASLIVERMHPSLADWYFDAVHDFGQSHWDDDAGALTGADFDSHDHFQRWAAMTLVSGKMSISGGSGGPVPSA